MLLTFALYLDLLNLPNQVSAYQMPASAPYVFPPGPDLMFDGYNYYVWIGSLWQRLNPTDWIVGAGKSGTVYLNSVFLSRFQAV